MRRREDATSRTLPEHLTTYAPDPETMTTAEWQAGYEQWQRARAAWARRHGIDVDELPAVIGDEPFDPNDL